MSPHIFLALACAALLGTIAAQDYLYKPLRNETISAGLSGPYHWYLDASYVPLAAALCIAFRGHPWMTLFAVIAAVALILVAVTNTFSTFVDKLTKGQHSLWHSRFTIVVFVAALLLQIAGDSDWRWILTALNVIIPGACYLYFHLESTDIDGVVIQASPAAEKLYVTGLCIWLIAWVL